MNSFFSMKIKCITYEVKEAVIEMGVKVQKKLSNKSNLF